MGVATKWAGCSSSDDWLREKSSAPKGRGFSFEANRQRRGGAGQYYISAAQLWWRVKRGAASGELVRVLGAARVWNSVGAGGAGRPLGLWVLGLTGADLPLKGCWEGCKRV